MELAAQLAQLKDHTASKDVFQAVRKLYACVARQGHPGNIAGFYQTLGFRRPRMQSSVRKPEALAMVRAACRHRPDCVARALWDLGRPATYCGSCGEPHNRCITV